MLVTYPGQRHKCTQTFASCNVRWHWWGHPGALGEAGEQTGWMFRQESWVLWNRRGEPRRKTWACWRSSSRKIQRWHRHPWRTVSRLEEQREKVWEQKDWKVCQGHRWNSPFPWNKLQPIWTKALFLRPVGWGMQPAPCEKQGLRPWDAFPWVPQTCFIPDRQKGHRSVNTNILTPGLCWKFGKKCRIWTRDHMRRKELQPQTQQTSGTWSCFAKYMQLKHPITAPDAFMCSVTNDSSRKPRFGLINQDHLERASVLSYNSYSKVCLCAYQGCAGTWGHLCGNFWLPPKLWPREVDGSGPGGLHN